MVWTFRGRKSFLYYQNIFVYKIVVIPLLRLRYKNRSVQHFPFLRWSFLLLFLFLSFGLSWRMLGLFVPSINAENLHRTTSPMEPHLLFFHMFVGVGIWQPAFNTGSTSTKAPNGAIYDFPSTIEPGAYFLCAPGFCKAALSQRLFLLLCLLQHININFLSPLSTSGRVFYTSPGNLGYVQETVDTA